MADTNNQKLRVTELDFDEIKDNLKTFLKNQSEFKDYDFEGSGMSILLDTLAYNTHYMGFNANMLANEMFLDSAALRSSVVSHAKTLGYEPNSCRAPKATIGVALTTTNSTATMPAGTKFTSTVDGVSYQFVTITSRSASSSGNTINFDNTEIYEGTYVTTKYTVDNSDTEQRFIITDNRADTTTLTVTIQNSSSDTFTTTFTKATDISQLTINSNVYFLQEVEQGRFEVYFGDGVVSKSLTDGNIVILQYVVTNKTAANGANSFSSPSSISGITDIGVTLVASAAGGAEPESIDSIKLSAPLDFAAQGRCVTRNDYSVFTKKLFPNTQAVSVWGGEDGSFDSSLGVTSTPSYGKVFISIKSNTGQNLTSEQKTSLVKSFGPFTVASITPVIVDPETTFLILGTTFMFDSTKTVLVGPDLEAAVITAITNYNDTSLKNFNSPFRHSVVTGLIDDVDAAILNNTTTVTMAKFFTPTISSNVSYTISFNNPLFNPHSGHNADNGGIVASTGFKVDGRTEEMFFDDDGKGNLRMYYLQGSARTYYATQAGTVNYSTGVVSTNAYKFTSVSDVDGATSTKVRMTVIPNSNDVVPVRNQLLEIDLVNSTFNSSIDATATTGVGYTVDSTGGSSQTTTTSVSTTPSSPASSGSTSAY